MPPKQHQHMAERKSGTSYDSRAWRKSQSGQSARRIANLPYRLQERFDLQRFAQKKYHVGRQVNAFDDAAYKLYSEETLAQDGKAFFMKVQDIIRSALTAYSSGQRSWRRRLSRGQHRLWECRELGMATSFLYWQTT